MEINSAYTETCLQDICLLLIHASQSTALVCFISTIDAQYDDDSTHCKSLLLSNKEELKEERADRMVPREEE